MKFHPLVQEWFERSFASATTPQELAWNEIVAGRDVLISAPTGSGKTLAAFLLCIDHLVRKALEGRLPRLLKGMERPTDAGERLSLALF